MILPKGVTGFAPAGEAAKPVDMRQFRGHCYDTARMVGGKVLRTEPPNHGVLFNFAIGIIEVAGRAVAVLRNAYFPIIGFADVPVDQLAPEFVDAPQLVEAFRSIEGYHVLDRGELEQPLTAEMIAELGKGETSEFRYWKPAMVGHVIFNGWD